MKKIISTLGLATTLFVMGAHFASAQYYDNSYDTYGNYTYGNTNTYSNGYTPYYNTYNTGSYSNSYQFMQGCYIYSYDRYTRVTSLVGSRCNTSTNYNTNYTYPTTNTYTYPVQTSYTSPNTYYNNGYNSGCNYATYGYAYYNSNCYQGYGQGYSGYGTYQYVNGAWVAPSAGYTYPNYNYNNNNNYNNGGCYYVNGQMACY